MEIVYANGRTNAKSTVWPLAFDWIRQHFVSPAVILDLGAGTHVWRARDTQIIGVDRIRRNRCSNSGDFLLCDLNRGIPLRSKTVDYAVAVEVIEHLENPRLFLREIQRLVKKKAIVTCPNGIESGWYNPWTYGFLGHITIITAWLLEKHFRHAGLQILEKRYDSPKEEIVLYLLGVAVE
jgi:SAM-dependent methyltransferase